MEQKVLVQFLKHYRTVTVTTIFLNGIPSLSLSETLLVPIKFFPSEGTETWTGLAKFLTRRAESDYDGSEVIAYLVW